jgi:murein DD-endopeptidase MepM/ murein hydrolase activator NlpD
LQNFAGSNVGYFTTTLGYHEGLSLIARRNNLNLDTLLSVNNINTLAKIEVGRDIIVPNQNGISYTIGRFDTVAGLARRFNITEESIIITNNLHETRLTVGQKLFLPGVTLSKKQFGSIIKNTLNFPVNGTIKSYFGEVVNSLNNFNQYNYGLTFTTSPLAPVFAIADGEVSQSGFHPSFGYFIVIDHNNLQSFYGYLSRAYFYTGTKIKRNQLIGRVGESGNGNGRSLFFSLIKEGKAVDPLLYLK